jgi:hypothetical protein
MSGRIWMEHAEHGGRAQLPDLPFWRAQGWEPADGPPPEPDLTKDPLPDAEPAEQTESPEDSSGLSATQSTKPAAAAQIQESDSDR